MNGTVNQVAWNLLSDGPVTLRFYVNNTFSQIIFSEVQIIRDATSPIIPIIDPIMNEIFEIAPAYQISVSDAHLDQMWYSFDQGSTKVVITSMLGVMDQTLWNQLPNGYVIIRFYANDTLGNVSFDEVIVVKDTPTPSPLPGIPGFNVFILLGMMSLIATVIIRSKFTKK